MLVNGLCYVMKRGRRKGGRKNKVVRESVSGKTVKHPEKIAVQALVTRTAFVLNLYRISGDAQSSRAQLASNEVATTLPKNA